MARPVAIVDTVGVMEVGTGKNGQYIYGKGETETVNVSFSRQTPTYDTRLLPVAEIANARACEWAH